jgi:hypothetical protein
MRGTRVPSPKTGLFTSAQLRRAVVRTVGVAAMIGVAGAALAACTSSPSADSANGASLPPSVRTLAPSQRPATTPVPAPTQGTIHQHVHQTSVQTHARVPLNRSARFATGLTVRVLSATVFHAHGRLPGEISGPAVRVNVRITNGTHRTVSLGGIAPTCTDAHGTPLVAMQSRPVDPFAGSLMAGRSASAVYVFELARVAPEHTRFTLSLGNSATKSIVQFYGRAS